jgi:hypothetical protein
MEHVDPFGRPKIVGLCTAAVIGLIYAAPGCSRWRMSLNLTELAPEVSVGCVRIGPGSASACASVWRLGEFGRYGEARRVCRTGRVG